MLAVDLWLPLHSPPGGDEHGHATTLLTKINGGVLLSRLDDFVVLWKRHGHDWTWAEYAQALATMGHGGTNESNLKVWVSRNREKLRREHGIDVGQKRVSAADEFNAWPPLPRALRNHSIYRLLEYHARVRALGIENLAPSLKNPYLWQVGALRENNLVIRWDPDRGFYRSERTSREALLDPGYSRISEPRESYLARHPDEAG